jgi:hypothetical protein
MARVAALPYLDDDKPPKRLLLVGRDAQIVVVE